MKIHLIKLYKTTILFFLVSGTAVIIGMVILAVASGQVSESGGRIMLMLSVSPLLEEYAFRYAEL